MQSYTFGVLKHSLDLLIYSAHYHLTRIAALDLPMPRQILGFVLPFMCSFEYRALYLLALLIQSLRYMRASNNTLLPFHPVSRSLAISRTSAFICGGKWKKYSSICRGGGHFNDLWSLLPWIIGPLSVAFSCKVCLQDVSTLRLDEIQKRVSAFCF